MFATAAAAQVYTIETIAGGGDGVGDDGPAIRAKLTEPTGVAVDAAGNIYIADRHNHRVRKVDTSGTISTFAGTNVDTRDYDFNGDGGPADRALVAFPEGVVVDVVGNVYIADTDNHRIRMVDAAGIIHTIAGSGERGFDGDGGPPTQPDKSLARRGSIPRPRSRQTGSPSPLKTQIWIAVSVYVLVAIVRKRLGLEASLYQILQILSVTLFEKTPILRALQPSASQENLLDDPNQLILFDF